MRILINCFGTTSQVDTCNTQTIASLTSDVIVSQNLSENCYLTSAQGALPESALVSDLLTEGSQISVAMNLCGGGKKKQFSTPKKNKHKKKNIPKAVLSYYAIENDGTVKRVKRRSEGGTSKKKNVFMASHWNRYYCGTTHLTLTKKDAPKEEPKRAIKEEVVAVKTKKK